MKKDKVSMEEMLQHFENEWDIHDLKEDHEQRFLTKQKEKRQTKNYWYPIAVAASLLLLIGLYMTINDLKTKNDFRLASVETQRTDSVFSAILQVELNQIKERKSPRNEKIIDDALLQMKQMDEDYAKIKQELIEKGENKQIIYALIHNYKVRIEFLENVLQQLNNVEKLNTISYEKTI